MRTLIIAPHPDDAVIAAGGLAQIAPRDTHILHVTAGDGFWRDAAEINGTPFPTPAEYLVLGNRRIHEATQAAKVLGVPAENLTLLGFPDSQITQLLDIYDRPIYSRHTNVDVVPYPGAYRPGSPYTGRDLEAQLQAVITNLRPEAIAYPSPHDHNHDHRAIGIVVEARLPANTVGYAYLVHHDLYPGLPWGLHYGRVLRPGSSLPQPHAEYILTPDMERTKERAIRAFQSQMLAMGDWLLSFVAVNEPFHEVTR